MNSRRYTGKESIQAQYSGEKELPEESVVRALVERASGGDVNAFGKLYDIYLDQIYRYVFYRAKDRMVAEDLSQQVFVKAWEAISKFEWRGKPFSAWLFRIAHNHLVDYYRSSEKDARMQKQISVDIDDPQQETEQKLMQEELLKAVAHLTLQQQEVIILKFVEGLENREIAEIMGKKEGAIRVMQMRALSALRQKLNGAIEWQG